MTREELEQEVARLSKLVVDLEWRLHIATVSASINAGFAEYNQQALQHELEIVTPLANQYVASETERMMNVAGLRK